MRSPKAKFWWAWKKNNTKKNEKDIQSDAVKLHQQYGGSIYEKESSRVKYLPTISLPDPLRVRERLDDIWIIPSGLRPSESLE